MEVKGQDLSMIRGDSEAITVELSTYDPDTQQNVKVPLVNGDVVYFTVKLNTQTAEKILQKKIETFIDGNAVIELTPSDTENIAYRAYKYDIQIVRADGTVATVLGPAIFTIKEEITFEKV